MTVLLLTLTTLLTRLTAPLSQRVEGEDPERGDVPGWVMVTVMSAFLVVALLAVAREPLANAFTNALNSVTGN